MANESVKKQDITRCSRLGDRKDKIIRPALVEMRSMPEKLKIMKNLNKLKSLQSRISVVSDMTHKQREEYKALKEEAKVMEAQSGDKKYRVVGPPGRQKIKKIPFAY